VTVMSRYTNEQIAAIRRQSERLLREGPRPPAAEPPPPAREVPPIVLEDPVQQWKREADEASAIREANRAANRRQAHENARVLTALERLAALEARIAELEQSVATPDATSRELAQGTVTFAQAVDQGLVRMEKHLAELSGKLTELRAANDLYRGGSVIDLPDFRRRAN